MDTRNSYMVGDEFTPFSMPGPFRVIIRSGNPELDACNSLGFRDRAEAIDYATRLLATYAEAPFPTVEVIDQSTGQRFDPVEAQNATTQPTIARAAVEINRVHPDARDASVSSRGHERTISNYWKQGTTFNEINAWIASIAPEVNVNGAPSYANDPDQYSAFYFLPSAKDRRGYSTYTYIRLYFAPVEVEAPKPTEEEVIASPEFIVYVDAARAYDAATTIEELDRTTDTLMASREALAVVCRQYVHLIHACEKECKRRIQAKCLLCGQPITDGDRTVNGRTIHEACYLAQFEKPKPALDAAYWAEYARNNPAQQYAPSFGWANPEGN